MTAQDQQSRAELLPCPFCGGAPETTGPWEIGFSDNYETCICCEKCGFHISSDDGFTSGEKQSLAKAIERWNRRAPAKQDARAMPAGMDGLHDVIRRCADFIENAPVSSGVCCCGDSIEDHADPMNCGHSPRDQWDYSAESMVAELRAATAAAQVQAMGRVPPGWARLASGCAVMLEQYAVDVEYERGIGRTLDELRAAGDLPKEIAELREMAAAAPRPPAAQEGA